MPDGSALHIKPPMSWAMRIFLFFVVCIVGIFLFGATIVAKTGVFQVPFFSRFISSVGEPTRLVKIPAMTQTTQETFATQFQGAIGRYARSRTEEDRNFQIRVSEASVTKTVLAEIPAMKDKFQGAEVKYAQLAIDADAMEFFVRLVRDGRENTLKARFTVAIESGKPVVKLSRIQLGSLSLPSFVANSFLKLLGESGMDDAMKQINSVATLKNTELRSGVFILNGQLNTGVLNGR